MDILSITAIAALTGAALLLILYPIWQQTRPTVALQPIPPGQTLAEHQARYQAALATIKDLTFDFEMGKISAQDHHQLLHKTKLEAAQIRRQIDLLSHNPTDIAPALDDQIETLVAQLRTGQSTGPKRLRQQVDAEIAALKNSAACPACGSPHQPNDAFCARCGAALDSAAHPQNYQGAKI